MLVWKGKSLSQIDNEMAGLLCSLGLSLVLVPDLICNFTFLDTEFSKRNKFIIHILRLFGTLLIYAGYRYFLIAGSDAKDTSLLLTISTIPLLLFARYLYFWHWGLDDTKPKRNTQKDDFYHRLIIIGLFTTLVFLWLYF